MNDQDTAPRNNQSQNLSQSQSHGQKPTFDVYEVAREICRGLRPLLPRIAKVDRDLVKHLRESGRSVSLNVAEGNRRTGGDRLYHFKVAAGSADEVQAGLHNAEDFGYVRAEELRSLYALLDRELAMLWRLTHPR